MISNQNNDIWVPRHRDEAQGLDCLGSFVYDKIVDGISETTAKFAVGACHQSSKIDLCPF